MALSNILWVFLGGGIGSVLRFVVTKTFSQIFANLYWGTLSVNLVGSLLIGLLIGFEIKSILHQPILLLLATGFCGGFTTFSAFSLESLNLIKSGQYLYATSYILISIILGIIAVGLGFYLARQI
ncbi:fluoride efflux transporter CrcB [Flavobacterium sp. CS20]|jgi:CrcB protein|uniref:fluoride efflux transporter CrcB n=1 Tax=Flavobacterium sp. CS20 TaxID=2775246 RepID=UPI001B39F755|nr:fluoride efflux transporter CrcB [Flavobacterium sp. CS20]QTY25849.1 fluoride efflux transporter CrcB [Flavobacterium sp. CS20]